MWSLHSQKRLNSQGDRQVQARLGVFEVQARDLADAIEAVAERVWVDAQAVRGLLLLAGFEIGGEGGDERALARAVVLNQRAEVAPAVVHQAPVAHRREQAARAPLRPRARLAPPLDPAQ